LVQDDLPEWARDLVAATPPRAAPDRLMRLAIALAQRSVEHGGGPFGAVVADAEGNVVSVGWNRVVEMHDSTAHAEVLAMRAAQAMLATHDLHGFVLYTSCAPCIQCYGALWWSGIERAYAAAEPEDAQTIGFSEGPVDETLWRRATDEKGLRYTPRFLREEALAPLRAYARRGGPVY
jgi:tRNA(Arg) A34 adenosine deaminase TadA